VSAAQSEDDVKPSGEGKTRSDVEQMEERHRTVEEPRRRANSKKAPWYRTEKFKSSLALAVAPVIITALLAVPIARMQSGQGSGNSAAAATERSSDLGAVKAKKILDSSSVRVHGIGWNADGSVTIRFNGVATHGYRVFVHDGEVVWDAGPFQINARGECDPGWCTVAVVGDQSGHETHATFYYDQDHRVGEIYEDGTPAPGSDGLGLPSNQAQAGPRKRGPGTVCWPDPCPGEDGRPSAG
jgi:hypothetical protein